jgi:uncharacterized LabA/DUF88 family protein
LSASRRHTARFGAKTQIIGSQSQDLLLVPLVLPWAPALANFLQNVERSASIALLIWIKTRMTVIFPRTKSALFIDGHNLYATAKALGFDIDYKRLLSEFEKRAELVRALYYTAIVEDEEYSSGRTLIDWLGYNGYTVVTKAAKEFVDEYGRRKVKGDLGIELAVDALQLAEHIDDMVLFSGDGDFRSLVEAMQRRGVRVTVVSTISSRPPMVANELRRQADLFTDVIELKPAISRVLT